MINSGVVLLTFLIAVNFYRMGRVYLGLQVESISPSLQEKPGRAGGIHQPAESRERRNAVMHLVFFLCPHYSVCDLDTWHDPMHFRVNLPSSVSPN